MPEVCEVGVDFVLGFGQGCEVGPETTLMKVPRVKAKETMPIIPEIRKKGEVAVVDTTTPMAG